MANYIDDYMGTLKDPAHEASGVYRARVEANMDPLKIGRVRVRVPMFHGDQKTGIKTKDLPWAYPSSQSAGYGYGTFIVPEVGEWVFVIFEDCDKDYPVYIGSSYGKGSSESKTYGDKDGQGTWSSTPNSNEVPTDAQRAEPTRKVIYKSPKGASVEIDEKNGEEQIAITDALGQMFKLESHLTKGTSHKRSKDDMDSLKDVKPYTSGSRAVMRAAGKQYLEMTMKDGVRDIKADLCEGFVVHLKDDNGTITALFEHKSGSKIFIDETGIYVEGVTILNLKGTQTVGIEAGQTMDISAGQTVNINGGQTVNVNGGQTVNVNGGNSVVVSAPSIVLKGDVTIIGS